MSTLRNRGPPAGPCGAAELHKLSKQQANYISNECQGSAQRKCQGSARSLTRVNPRWCAALRAFDGRLPKRAHNHSLRAGLCAAVTARCEASGNGRSALQNRSFLLRRAVESAVCGPVQRPWASMDAGASKEAMRVQVDQGNHCRLDRRVRLAVALSYASEALQWRE